MPWKKFSPSQVVRRSRQGRQQAREPLRKSYELRNRLRGFCHAC